MGKKVIIDSISCFYFQVCPVFFTFKKVEKELQLISSLSNGMINLLDRAIIKSYFEHL